MTASGPSALPWSQRIELRLALGLTALLTLGYFLFPRVHDFSLRLFGLPGIDEPLLPGAPMPQEEMVLLAQELLSGARQEGPGRWLLDEAVADELGAALATRPSGLAWFDADGLLVWSSTKDAPRETSRSPLEEDGTFLGPAVEGIAVGRAGTTVYKDGELAGTLVVYPLVRPSAGENRTGLEGGFPSAFPDRSRWADRVLNLAAILFIAVLAATLSWIISRTVTRRVKNLAALASAPVGAGTDLPGPFDDSGSDEIASLAHSMNGMRSRVLELLADLERQDQDRRDWIAMVSHDLRTPLTALTACLDRAGELAREGGGNAEVSKRLGTANLDARRLGVLIEDLLDVARLEAADALTIEPVPPGELVRQTVRELESLAEREGVELEAHVAPGLPILSADGQRLMRALENLTRNAIDHAQSAVRVAVLEEGPSVCFEVRDDGPGLPEVNGAVHLEVLARHRDRPDSAGLGLKVVSKVAEAHGGESGGENLPEGGARVWFSVPAP